MSSLRLREKNVLEAYLEMGNGYVLNFSDRTYRVFFQELGIDIDDLKYSDGNTGSKANRLRKLWEIESDEVVGVVLKELIQYSEDYRPGHDKTSSCMGIVTRLSQAEEQVQNAIQTIDSEEVVHAMDRTPIEMFFSYAHEDELLMNEVRRQLVTQERNGRITKWHDRMIPPGDEWRTHIDQRIHTAQVILLFMSPDFLESKYCTEVEGAVALRRHELGQAKVIPIILRACDWESTVFGKLQALPVDGMPFNQMRDRDQASLDIARGIMAGISIDE